MNTTGCGMEIGLSFIFRKREEVKPELMFEKYRRVLIKIPN